MYCISESFQHTRFLKDGRMHRMHFKEVLRIAVVGLALTVIFCALCIDSLDPIAVHSADEKRHRGV